MFLTVNWYVKKSACGIFGTWYYFEIGNKLNAATKLHYIDVPFYLLLLKLLHAQCLVGCYNQMRTKAAQNAIHGKWKTAGNTEALWVE